MTTAVSHVGAFVLALPDAQRPDAELYIATDSPGLRITVRTLRPESQGTVLIRSTDPRQPPAIRGNFLGAAADRRLMVAMIRYVRRLAATAPLARHLAAEFFPGSACASDDELVAVARRSGMPGSHFAGTCKMGTDDLAVVDERLRVRGVTGLRVIDGSIMPTLVSANTSGPIMAMAWACRRADQGVVTELM